MTFQLPKVVIPRYLTVAAIAVGAAFALGAPTPAHAGGNGYYGGYYGGYHGGYKHGYYGRRHHRHHRRHYRRGGGGDAALIALGVIGGAIILNEYADSRARQRAYDERYYRARRPYNGGYYESRRPYYDDYDRSYDSGRAYAPSERPLETAPTTPSGGDELDTVLDGGANEAGRISVAEAYQACLRRVRTALSERGFIVSAPYEPETADDLGGSWKMTATLMTQRGAEDTSRAMYCEADAERVYLVELI